MSSGFMITRIDFIVFDEIYFRVITNSEHSKNEEDVLRTCAIMGEECFPPEKLPVIQRIITGRMNHNEHQGR